MAGTRAAAIRLGDGELRARALLLQEAQDAIAFQRERSEAAEARLAEADARITRVLAVTGAFLTEYGHGDAGLFKAGRDLANSVAKILNAPVGSGSCAEHEGPRDA
jgi:hypothetical protein